MNFKSTIKPLENAANISTLADLEHYCGQFTFGDSYVLCTEEKSGFATKQVTCDCSQIVNAHEKVGANFTQLFSFKNGSKIDSYS